MHRQGKGHPPWRSGIGRPSAAQSPFDATNVATRQPGAHKSGYHDATSRSRAPFGRRYAMRQAAPLPASLRRRGRPSPRAGPLRAGGKPAGSSQQTHHQEGVITVSNSHNDQDQGQPTETKPIMPLTVLRAFEVAVEGWTPSPDSLEDWPNTVSVSAVEGYQRVDDAEPEADHGYADQHGARHLVEIDTNYKPSRPGQHPVRLTRADAVHLAAHVLTATEDTFHFSRVGSLRAVEAAELLQALTEVEHALTQLRSHALEDLLADTGVEAGE